MKQQKHYFNAIILAVIGGWIGLQNFYVKQTICGVLGVLFWWTGIPAFVGLIQSYIWLIQGPDKFNDKFNNKN